MIVIGTQWKSKKSESYESRGHGPTERLARNRGKHRPRESTLGKDLSEKNPIGYPSVEKRESRHQVRI